MNPVAAPSQPQQQRAAKNAAAAAAAATSTQNKLAFESLEEFGVVMHQQLRRRCIAKVDRQWYNFIHHNRAKNFSSLNAEFQRLASGEAVSKAPPCTELFAQVSKVMISGSPQNFMAPMCCPLTRQKLSLLTDPEKEYFVNEKSDGLRVILVSNIVTEFPRWCFPGRAPLSLYDTGLLEEARLQLQDGSNQRTTSSEMQLSFGPHALKAVDAAAGHFQLILTRSPPNAAPGAPQAGASCDIVRRVGAKHFTYLFDRSMSTPYLLFDEYHFNGLASVILDGELLITIDHQDPSLPPPRAQMGVFDIFSYTPLVASGERDPATGVVPITRGDAADLTRKSMSERYELIQSAALDPLQKASGNYPYSVRVFRKDMWPLQDLPKIFALLKKKDDEYIFNNESTNDGLIFTPNAFDLYTGSHDDQLKWKWPSKLSVDWRLTPAPGKNWKDRYATESFFRKIRFKQPDVFGHTPISRGVNMRNAKHYTIAEGTIAECSFNEKKMLWDIVKIRADKTEANSVTTMMSVVESIAERLDSIGLRDSLGLWEDEEDMQQFVIEEPAEEEAPKKDEVAPTATTVPAPTSQRANAEGAKEWKDPVSCHMIVNVQTGNHHPHLKLQWQCRLPTEKNPITCNHVDVRQCFGLGEPCPAECSASQLEGKIAIALANAGGCMAWSDMTVEVFFDPKRGRWGIGSIGNSKNQCYSSLVLMHLEHVAKQSLRGAEVQTLAGADERFAEERKESVTEGTEAHYAERTKQLRDKHLERSTLRTFNNWVKGVLVHTTIEAVQGARGLGANDRKIAVLDLCSGRGGDLPKWKVHPLAFLFCVDSCFEAVAEAAMRYSKSIAGLSTKITKSHEGFPGIPAHFEVHDCFDGDLSNTITGVASKRLNHHEGYDIASCQFSMHYAFGAVDKVRGFLKNVSSSLRCGGSFIGTTVDDSAVAKWRQTHGDTFGNSVFKVEIVQEEGEKPLYGTPYRFTLEESVSDEVEYIVDWAQFVKLAHDEFRLRLVESMNFEQFFEQYNNSEIGQRLQEKSAKRDASGDPINPMSLTDDEKEAAYMYRAFVFEKF